MRFKMLYIIKVTIFISFCITLFSCGPVPFDSVMGGPVPISFHGETGSSRSLGDIVAYSETPSRYITTAGSDLQNWFDAYYANNLGSYQNSYTPTKFVLPVGSVALMNKEKTSFIVGGIGEPGLNADFTDPSVATTNEVARGFYDYLLISSINRFDYIESQHYTYIYTSSIEVNTAPYLFVEQGPFPYQDNSSLEGWDVKQLGGTLHRFTYNTLLPKLHETAGAYDALSVGGDLNYILFSTKLNVPTLVTAEGNEVFSVMDFTGNPSDKSTVQNILILPWDGLDIPFGAREIEVALTLNLNDIIEVYDGESTPVLANSFWERFNIRTNVVY